ncbi:MAG: hypothetical protein JXQ29_04920 [Planctomycetes bacterium]|nr:hypothetical protein [Planctomycetota bacterium]
MTAMTAGTFATWLAMVALAVLAAAGGAQPVVGDLVFGKIDTTGPGPGLYWVDAAGRLGTILRTDGGRFPNAVAMADDNRALVVAMSGSPDRLLQVAVDGSVTTLVGVLPDGSPNGLARDQDGSWLVSASLVNAVFRVDPGTQGLTTVYAHGPESRGIVNAVAVEGTTQNYLVGIYGSTLSSTTASVLRVDRSGAVAATLATGASWEEISSVGWDWDVGRVTTTKFTAPEFVRVGPGGAVATVAAVAGANAHVLAGDRSFWVGGDGLVRRIDAQSGGTVQTHVLPGFLPTAVEIYGHRPLRTTGSAASGQTLTFHLNSARPADAGKRFVLAFSMVSVPGVPLPDGRMVRMGVDTFVIANAGGVLSPLWNGGTNFGVLDAGGAATARLTIPAGFSTSAKFRFYAVFVTLDPAGPSGIGTVSNVVPFTTNL